MPPVNPAKAFLSHLAKVANMREFAKKVGVSEVTFSRWKNGDEPPNPKLETLIKIARILHVQVADLLDDEREPDLTSFSKVPVSRGSIGAGAARLDEEPNEDAMRLTFEASVDS